MKSFKLPTTVPQYTRTRFSVFMVALCGLVGALPLAQAHAAGSPVSFPGLADPGRPLGIQLQAGTTQEIQAGTVAQAVLRGPDSSLQLVVTGKYDSGQLRDWTGQATYTAAPAGIVRVEPSGAVVPLADGKATITAAGPAGMSASVVVTVADFGNAPPINFPNQITPIFTKLGCNSGGCHGKSGGQNGFRLSLLGFEPAKDYRYLVQDSRGRRLFPAAPEQSLLLQKPTNVLPHGGGEKLKLDSRDYRLIYRWIAQGMPYGRDSDPTLESIDVFPHTRTLPRDGSQQLLVIAKYSDGSTEDITSTTQLEPNDKDMAEITPGGAVTMMGRPGTVAVMARYQAHVSVFQATVPVGAPVDSLPPARNFVDELAFGRFKELGLPPSAVCDDSTFLRRVTLDITGRLPTIAEGKAFLADRSQAKRDACIDRLLASGAYADFFADKWCAILRNRREKESYQRGNYLFHEWVRNSILSNKPYDQFVRELLTASGDVTASPAVSWFRQADDATKEVEDTAQVFLGVRIGCAKCHHHPFEKWSQNDYYGMAAFFSQVRRKAGSETDESRVYHLRGEAIARNPADGKAVKPTALGAPPVELTVDDDPRTALADWLTRKENPFFARALANRYWKHFFGRGIVDPEDDMRETNPPSNPQLLDGLATHFAQSNYDLKDLIRSICRSQLYQLSASPNAFNASDRQSFSHYYPRRLPAEVMLDAIDQFDGTHSAFRGMPADARAVQVPDLGTNTDSYFLTVFGRPAGASACECERSGEVSLAQTLTLLNSNEIHDKVSGESARRYASAEDARSDEQKVTDLYYAAFTRPPTEHELQTTLTYIRKGSQGTNAPAGQVAADRRAAYEDLLWALMNTKEFLFNH